MPRRSKGSKLHLMHAVLDMGIGGLQRLVTDMSLALDRDLYQVEVCCFDQLGCFADKLRDNHIEVTLLQKNQRRFDASYPFRLARFLHRKKTDILQMHTGSFFFGSLAGAMSRIPATVYTEHGRFHIEPRVRLIEDRISAVFVDRIIAVSRDLESYLSDRVKLPARKICTVINGIETSRFVRGEKDPALLKEFNISKDCQVIGTVGRLDEVKDQLTMIQAFEQVHLRQANTKLMLVGDGPLREELFQYINRNNLDGKVIITGQREDIPELLSLFDVFILSSLSEGTSISLLEAMAAGVPSVVTAVGGNSSIVQNNENGILVEIKNPTQIADALSAILTDNEKRGRLGSAAARTVREHYSLSVMVEQYVDLYQKILTKKHKPRH